MDKIQIKKINEVYIRVTGEPHIEQELSDYFQFTVPNSGFIPSVRKKNWNGNVYLYGTKTKLIYAGLLEHVKQFCKERNIEIEYFSEFNKQEFSLLEAEKFVSYIKPSRIPRDYQIDAFLTCVRNNRALILSPTGSGKSFTIYLLSMLYSMGSKRKVLIIVPTITLVHQMADDFVDYGYINDNIHRITAGVDKSTECPIVISTWQSIVNMPRKWFDQFKAVTIDETHLAKAKSIKSIMTKLINCKYRFGFTGTLDNIECNKLIIEGLTGPTKKVISTKELMDRKQLAELKIKILLLKHNDKDRKLNYGKSYHDEMDFIVRNEERNKFIKNLVLSLKGNTMLLFQYVDKHGQYLYDQIKDNGIDVHFVHGGIEGEDREIIRKIVDSSENSITIASYGTFSTGTNIINLNNVVFASPSKSKIRVLQSIGRGLRVSDTKLKATLFDIADDLKYNNKKNHTLNHLFERVKNYDEERFSYRVYDIQLGKKLTDS